MNRQMGRQTACLQGTVSVAGTGCVAGKKEGAGPLGQKYDRVYEDTLLGTGSWEKAEAMMQREAFALALQNADATESSLRYLLGGDLLNQCISSAYGLRDATVPFAGLFGACSTFCEGLGLGAMLIDGGFADRLGAVTSSHFCAAERQFRLPLDYGGQRPPTAQWTVTGAGAAVLDRGGGGPRITHVTLGRIVDAGIKDISYMGAAMAPAAFDTIRTHFADTNTTPEDFDAILTGDLGQIGAAILSDLFDRDGMPLGKRYHDCGVLIYDLESDRVDAGGSGCACSALVFSTLIRENMEAGLWQNVLFCGTGALFSTVSAQQGESIPSICHAIRLRGRE